MKNILIYLSFIFIGCSTLPTPIDGTTLPYAEIEIPIKNNPNTHIIYKPLGPEDSICGFYFMERTDSILYKFDVDKNKVAGIYILSPMFGRLDDFTIDNDTIYALKYPYGEIIIQNIHDPATCRSFNYDSPDYMLGFSINKKGTSIFVQSFPQEVLNSPEKVINYYKKPIDNSISLKKGKIEIIKSFAPFPPIYCEGKNADCLHGIRCITDSNILYSYDYSENLDIYSLNGEKKSNSVPFSGKHFFLPPDFDLGKIQDLNYGYDYWNKTAAFVELQYNPWRKELYRILNHKSSSFSKLPSSKPWSLLIGPPEKGPRYEIEYPPFRYKNYYIIPTRTGYVLPRLSDSKKDTSNIKLHVFTFY